MVKYALGGAPFKEYPFTLTTDVNIPVCYLIKSARSKTDQGQWGNPSYWNYQSQGENASYYTIKEYGNENGDELVKNDINSYWFFVENKYGYIELVPFINPVSMGYVTVGDGAKKMTNNHTIQNFVGTEYSFENNVNNSWEGYPYALKPYGYNTYVSNHGGRNKMMGFYNEINDGGTRFTLIAANTPSVMLRNLHVAVVEAQEEYGAISIGNQVGQYSTDTANEFKKALEEATELLANAKSTSEECQEKLEALNGAVANLKFNLPEVGKFYTIKSASTSNYCKGKYVYALSTPEAAAYKTYDHRHLRFADMSPVRATALWQFTEDMKMKNVHTGEYVKSFGKNEQHMGAEAESKSISIRPLMNNDRQVSLTVSGASYPMHAQQDDAVIVVWEGGHNSASAWYIDEVNEFSHELNVGEAGWSSLVLGFDASIPDGTELYSVSEVENGAAILNPVTRVLPANTPVFVKAAKGNYQFDFSSEKPEAVKNNLLKGSLYDCYIGEESYVLAKGTSGVGLYKASLNKNASGAEGKSHFLNNANKAYMPASEVPAGARFLVFNFGDDDATAIEGIEAENTANAVVYDLAGRRVQNAQKGVFIVNGKVVVK